MKTVVNQLLTACRTHGIPSAFWTDVAHDVAAIEANPVRDFHWYLYGSGTHLHWTDLTAGWKPFSVSEWQKCMKTDFPGGKFFHCDGSTLRGRLRARTLPTCPLSTDAGR